MQDNSRIAVHNSNPPYIVGSVRHKIIQRQALRLRDIFLYEPPRCFFASKQQQLLRYALAFKTDEESALLSQTERRAVRYLWERIFEKARNVPDMANQAAFAREGSFEQKKACVLEYVRRHICELRPLVIPRGALIAVRRTPENAPDFKSGSLAAQRPQRPVSVEPSAGSRRLRT